MSERWSICEGGSECSIIRQKELGLYHPKLTRVPAGLDGAIGLVALIRCGVPQFGRQEDRGWGNRDFAASEKVCSRDLESPHDSASNGPGDAQSQAPRTDRDPQRTEDPPLSKKSRT